MLTSAPMQQHRRKYAHDIVLLEFFKKKVEEAYKDEKGWARMAMLNTACAGKFTSDRTIEEYVDDIWHLDKVFIK